MGLAKYKYYFRKPRSAIVKDILYWLLMAGAVYLAAGSPCFARNLWREYRRFKKYPKKRVFDTFYNLKRQGLIDIKKQGAQIYISLTEEGRKKAGFLQINDLKINQPKNWDKKWRLVIFDIAQLKKVYREAFRGKLKELGFYPLQKSVWVHPFDCGAEIELLKDFFGLSDNELRLIVAEEIGNDKKMRDIFKI
ncbi:hypothetical protein L6250_02100 [Candidatus Parcubacteria bacterium]|nr:hypothetical protein [Patescibacteria group bacterium]MBU4467009.1 hypothetical protein [Patescibacteria group bacterium]MCG2688408.1 hypothetical protein [Candidatus Parcubacteria bacterium]